MVCVPSTPRASRSNVRFLSHRSASSSFVITTALSRHRNSLFWNPSRRARTIAIKSSLVTPFTPASWIGPSWNEQSLDITAMVMNLKIVRCVVLVVLFMMNCSILFSQQSVLYLYQFQFVPSYLSWSASCLITAGVLIRCPSLRLPLMYAASSLL